MRYRTGPDDVPVGFGERDLEPASEREITLYDVADWLWAYRLLAALLALAGLGGAIALWATSPTPAPVYRTEFAIYSSGTPVRSSAEIMDILIGQLSESLPDVVFGVASNPLVVDFPSKAHAETAQRTVEELDLQLIGEVKQLQADTAALVRTSEAALTLNLDAKAFVEGAEAGLINIVRVNVRELTASKPVRSSILIVAAAGFLFLVLAGSHSFWQRWRAIRPVAR